jgi:DNA replication and repair protein RecF
MAAIKLFMNIHQLELKSFRNYHSLKINLSPQVNIFFGQNAQGKTNLLEAVALLCLGRSFRTKKDAELIGWGAEAAYVKGSFTTECGEESFEVGIGTSEKRIKRNGQPVKGSAALGQVPVVLFSPDDLQIIKGGPQYRRDFIDLYLAQIEPDYRFVYYNFAKVLQQRNRLLREGAVSPTELEVWDEQLIVKGAKVIKYRRRLVERATPAIAAAHRKISGSREELELAYLSFDGQSPQGESEAELQELFRAHLERWRPLELERRLSLVGPQRDELRLTLAGNGELRTYGSQGQHRTAALALKLGLVEELHEARGVYPLLLLDDVMSEFDDARKQALLELIIHSTQTLMTSTHRRDFPIDGPEAVFFQVSNGAVAIDSP